MLKHDQNFFSNSVTPFSLALADYYNLLSESVQLCFFFVEVKNIYFGSDGVLIFVRYST
jgi:hypothetical protein